MEDRRVARFPGTRGRIPNFIGAEAAAERLAELEEWKASRTLKSNPDSPQLPVRARALADGMRLYMAVPRLVDPKPFLMLDPKSLSAAPRRAASIRGATKLGRPVATSEMKRIDLVVCGSVAVNRMGQDRQGRRLLGPGARAPHRGRPGRRADGSGHHRACPSGPGRGPSRDRARLQRGRDRDAGGGAQTGSLRSPKAARHHLVSPR